MKLCALLVFLSVLVLVRGMPLNLHCHCLQVESRIIPPSNLRSIKLVPEGPHCPEIEVIAGLASGEKVCLNPRLSWVKKLVHFILERQLRQQAGVLARNRV